MAEYGEQDEEWDTGRAVEDYPPFYDGDKARYIGQRRGALDRGTIVEVTGCNKRSSDRWTATVRLASGERVTVNTEDLDYEAN